MTLFVPTGGIAGFRSIAGKEGRACSSCPGRSLHGYGTGTSKASVLWRSCLLGAMTGSFRKRRSVGVRGLHKSGDVLSTGNLPVGSGFELYYEEHGVKDGIPVVFLHGGPGAGSSRRMAQLFDPQKYRIILFDQRGCGKSTRSKSTTAEEQLEDNTTWHHVSDLEALRTHLKIDRWVVAGGSWGTCLALAYASKFKDRVLAMVLRAVPLSNFLDFRLIAYGTLGFSNLQ